MPHFYGKKKKKNKKKKQGNFIFFWHGHLTLQVHETNMAQNDLRSTTRGNQYTYKHKPCNAQTQDRRNPKTSRAAKKALRCWSLRRCCQTESIQPSVGDNANTRIKM